VGDSRARAWLWSSALLTLGALAAGALLAPPATASPVPALTWLLFLGSSVHVAATGYLFTLPGVRAHALAHPGRYLRAPAGLIVVAALVAVVLRPSQYGWVLLAYFCWQFSHFQKQNIGVVALAAGAFAMSGPGPAERRALSLAGWAGALALVAVCGGAVALLARPRAARPPGYWVVSLTSLGFFAPVFLSHSAYAAVAGMTIAHGLQYLVLVGMMSRGGEPGTERVVGAAAFLTIALLGGLALSAASHLHGGPAVERALFGLYLGLVMTHFVVDAGLWRLRQPFPRTLLASRLPYLVPPCAARRPEGDRSVADIR